MQARSARKTTGQLTAQANMSLSKEVTRTQLVEAQTAIVKKEREVWQEQRAIGEEPLDKNVYEEAGVWNGGEPDGFAPCSALNTRLSNRAIRGPAMNKLMRGVQVSCDIVRFGVRADRDVVSVDEITSRPDCLPLGACDH